MGVQAGRQFLLSVCVHVYDMRGWSQVSAETSCRVSGGDSKSESFCRDFWAKIEEPFKSCIQGECSEAVRQKAVSHPACATVKPQQSIRICK